MLAFLLNILRLMEILTPIGRYVDILSHILGGISSLPLGSHTDGGFQIPFHQFYARAVSGQSPTLPRTPFNPAVFYHLRSFSPAGGGSIIRNSDLLGLGWSQISIFITSPPPPPCQLILACCLALGQ